MLNTQEIFDDWARKVQQKSLGFSCGIFTMEDTWARTRRGNYLQLKVNFLPEIIQLSKKVRNLKNLGFRVVGDLFLHAYSNLHAWVARLDETVEWKLAGGLDAGIKAWTGVLAESHSTLDKTVVVVVLVVQDETGLSYMMDTLLENCKSKFCCIFIILCVFKTGILIFISIFFCFRSTMVKLAPCS